MLESLASLSLPEAHISLLQPSIQLGRVKRTRKHVLNDAQLREKLLGLSGTLGGRVQPESGDSSLPRDVSSLVGTTWRRKNKKRRALKAEKVLFDPVPKRVRTDTAEEGCECSGSLSESPEQEEEQQEEDGGGDGSSDGDDSSDGGGNQEGTGKI